MIDANSEIQRLRQTLRMRNLSETLIDSICDEAAREISSATSDLLANAMEEAIQLGGSMKATDFINEIKATRNGSGYSITTDSGKTDFSEPAFPMLPRLLKNAKVAKDGSLYKVIPMKARSASSGITSRTTEAALMNVEQARIAAKALNDSNNSVAESPSAYKGMDTLSAMQAVSKSRQKVMPQSNSGPIEGFRVASSKQDSSSKWVQPAKNRDMTSVLNNINANLHDNIDNTILDTIRRFEDTY